MNLNRITLIGRLTRDPDLKHTQGGKAVTQFGLAVDDGYGENKKTVFLDITCWNKTAEFVGQFCMKGSPVCVDGRLSMDTWEDKQTGQKRSKIYATANDVQLLERKELRQDTGMNYSTPTPAPPLPAPPFPVAPPPPVHTPDLPYPDEFVPDEPIDDIPF